MKYTRTSIYFHLKDYIFFSIKLMICSGIVTLLTTGVSLISPYLYRFLVDEVMIAGNIELLFQVILAMVSVYLVKLVLSGVQIYVDKKFSNDITIKTKTCMMKKFLERELSIDTGKRIGKEINNLEQDSDAVQAFLLNHVVGFVTSLAIAVIYMMLMISINFWMAILSIMFLPLTMWISQKIGNKYNDINKQNYEVKSKTKTYLFDTLQKWKEIKTNTLEDRFFVGFDMCLEPERKLNNKWIFYFAVRDFFYGIKTQFVLNVLAYFVGGLFVISKEISIGELLMFMNFMESMEFELDSIMKSKSEFLGQKDVFKRLFMILDEPEPIRGVEFPKNASICLREIDFSYAGEEKVLERVSCDFKYGKKYLLSGKSGEGKSTLIKLLLGLVKQQNGQLLFEKSEIHNIDSHSLLKNVGAVMQENLFFNLSIRENLKLIAPEATEEEMISALKAACLNDFVEKLPQKIDTIIGECGIKLSGGQRQRLAIARMILHNPQIVIMDEATSALDSVVEGEIFDKLNMIFKDKTMIVISHKPLVSFKKDKTYLIENKCVI